MKGKILVLLLIAIMSLSTIAGAELNSSIGYVDKNYILSKHPKWQEAEKERERIAKFYQERVKEYEKNMKQNNSIDIFFSLRCAVGSMNEIGDVMIPRTER